MSNRNKSPHEVNTSTEKPLRARVIDPAVASALIARCKANALYLGWKQTPFFLPAVGRVEFRPETRIPTAAVDLRGRIYINVDFAAKLKDAELQFVIAHELMHLLLLHHDRRGHRDPLKWNIATDLIINRTLKNVADTIGAGAFEMPKVVLIAPENQADLTAEQLYAEIEEPSEDMRAAFANGTIPVGQGCGVDDDGNGNGNGDKDSDGQEPRTPDQLKREWQECAAQCQMSGRQAGDVAGNMLADVLDIPDPLVRWSEVLRGALHRAIAEAGRDDVSWRRRSRRSTPEMILPGGITYRCKAAVVIDASGSVDDEALARCTAETTAIVNHCGVAVFLVVHDCSVQSATWIRPGVKSKVHQDVKQQMKGRGGTSFDEAYDRVEAEPGRFNVMVHLTDAEIGGMWPRRPSSVRRLVVALVGSANRENCPADARVIEVEI